MTAIQYTVSDVVEGLNVRDNYRPNIIREVYRQADLQDQGRLRAHFREEVEDGRFWEFLDEAHNLLAKSDSARRSHFKAHTSAWLREWIATFGMLEDLNTFPGVTGVRK